MAASLHAAVLLALATACLFASVGANSVPPGSCTLTKCNALTPAIPDSYKPSSADATAGKFPLPMAFYYGLWNKYYYPNQTMYQNAKNGPYVTYDVYTEVGTLLKLGTATTLTDCCKQCAATLGCLMFHYFPTVSSSSPNGLHSGTPGGVSGFVPGVKCYLITGGSYKEPGSPAPHGVPYSGTHSDQKALADSVDASIVGGLCNSSPGADDDPHFTGAHGTRFDFNGAANQPFCLISDERLHINTVLGGYEDNRGGTTQLRTWITALGLTYRVGDGAKHTLLLEARKSAQQNRGTGFLARVEVDGLAAGVPEVVGDWVAVPGGGRLALVMQTRKSWFDLDTFKLSLPGLLEATVQMRVAHPLLQTKENAYAHFNVHFDELKVSPRVHGVLGQTYRNTAEQEKKAMDFKMLMQLLRSPVHVDAKMGQGFLDGKTEDYKTSGPLETDCVFSAFS